MLRETSLNLVSLAKWKAFRQQQKFKKIYINLYHKFLSFFLFKFHPKSMYLPPKPRCLIQFQVKYEIVEACH